MVSVLIMSAGSSRRMGSVDKQLLPLCGEPVLLRSVRAFLDLPEVLEVLVVTGAERRSAFQAALFPLENGPVPVRVIACGGKTRQESVFAGMEEVSPAAEFVAIHDGARPLVRPADIARVFTDAKQYGAAILGVPVKDTIKIVTDAMVYATPDRNTLYQIQTPQVFRREDYRTAMAAAKKEALDFTDDAQLFEHAGRPVHLTSGSVDNLKITTPEDIFTAETVLRKREGDAPMVRVGQGYDVHRLVPGRKLILGGVEIPWGTGLLGHSDADVLLHAIMDALLGALALGDIGKHFPDTDPAYSGADSRMLLRWVGDLLAQNGWTVGNLDATVMAQAPKLRPHIEQMRENIAADLCVPLEKISVKATTEEGLGFTGEGAGMKASAICLLERSK